MASVIRKLNRRCYYDLARIFPGVGLKNRFWQHFTSGVQAGNGTSKQREQLDVCHGSRHA